MDECIEEILAHHTSDHSTLIAVDFDECVIEESLSRRVTELFAHRAEIAEEHLLRNDKESIRALLAAYVGLPRSQFDDAVHEQSSLITWRQEFLAVASQLVAPPYFFVFVTSGLATAVRTASTIIGLKNFHVVGTEIKFDSDNVVLGPSWVVGDAEKGDVVRMLSAAGRFDKVITVGHGKGDVHLIESGTPGYRFSLRDHAEAMAAADHVLEDWSEITRYL